MKYTTTKGTENAITLSSQIFDCQTFFSFAKNSEMGQFCFGLISMKTDSSIKVLGSRTNLLNEPTRWTEEKEKQHFLRGEL